jgi:hypothetical protein
MSRVDNKIHFTLVLKNMKKLKEISFGHDLPLDYDPFISQILQNSHKTLSVLQLPRFIMPDLTFSNMTNLTLGIVGDDISTKDFKQNFPQILKNMENLESVHLDMFDDWQLICEYINQNYSKHCIAGTIWDGI